MRGKGGSAARLLGATVLVWLGLAGAAHAAFPGENGRIAFARAGDIYTINPDGSGLEQLTSTGKDSEPAWSANGRRIAFTSTRDGNSEVYVMDASGDGQTNLTNHPADDSHPAWSPDGRRIAFDRLTPMVGYDIYVMDAGGGGATKVTEGVDPVWSPDGQRIAFVLVNNITLVNPDGTGLLELTHYPIPTRDSHVNSYDPNWSPDGRRIAWQRIGGNGPQFFYDLHVVPSDGGEQRSAYLYGHNGEGTWSPDGRQMVVQGYSSLDLLDVSSTDFATLPPFAPIPGTSYFDANPDWQPIVPGPQRADHRNGARYCKALRDFLGGYDFTRQYKSLGLCVSQSH